MVWLPSTTVVNLNMIMSLLNCFIHVLSCCYSDAKRLYTGANSHFIILLYLYTSAYACPACLPGLCVCVVRLDELAPTMGTVRVAHTQPQEHHPSAVRRANRSPERSARQSARRSATRSPTTWASTRGSRSWSASAASRTVAGLAGRLRARVPALRLFVGARRPQTEVPGRASPLGAPAREALGTAGSARVPVLLRDRGPDVPWIPASAPAATRSALVGLIRARLTCPPEQPRWNAPGQHFTG